MTSLTCHEVIDFLSDYLDSALPPSTAAAFEEHLAICPDCVAYLENFRATLTASRSALAAPANTPIPEDLVQAILASRRK
jgi:anti-sigma factor RsiW